ncbi:MAG TPA: UvrD-helicase domain-containing protein [Pseudonocardiaceae bacterium]|nr:UvrD-helicase domain-containing protein [Pseudonocardiaceae bacterium]
MDEPIEYVEDLRGRDQVEMAFGDRSDAGCTLTEVRQQPDRVSRLRLPTGELSCQCVTVCSVPLRTGGELMSSQRPTPEQDSAVATFRDGDDLVLQAGAGTGKTTTLTLLARATRSRGRYLAFNKAIATEARQKFPGHVSCSTAHSLAFKAIGHGFQDRLGRPRMSTAKLAQLLGIRIDVTIGQRTLRASTLCSLAQETVLRYCYSADEVIARAHVPWPKGIATEAEHDQLTQLVLPWAERMWTDLQHPEKGRVPFKHDHYLKMWALTQPRIYGDFLLLDEAQDTNPAIERVFLDQGRHAQLVMVGDSAQAIYGWRGARDVMTGFHGRQLALSHSFRFGAAVATEANRWLAIAEAPIRLTGSPQVTSQLSAVTNPDAILCRTNGGAMGEILALLADGRRVALAGRVHILKDLADAARDLQAGRRTTHRELLLFSTWGEVQEYVEWDPDGRDLQPFVDVIDEHGVDVVLHTLAQLCDEGSAEITVSTAHAAKGREWSAIRIAEDFTEPVDPDNVSVNGDPLPAPIEPAEARLAYVAVTRAQHRLDLGGLSWINQRADGNPPHR